MTSLPTTRSLSAGCLVSSGRGQDASVSTSRLDLPGGRRPIQQRHSADLAMATGRSDHAPRTSSTPADDARSEDLYRHDPEAEAAFIADFERFEEECDQGRNEMWDEIDKSLWDVNPGSDAAVLESGVAWADQTTASQLR